VVGNFGQAHEALVGHAEPHIGHAGAGDVEGFEAQVGDDACRKGIESTGDDDATLGGHQFLEFLAGRHVEILAQNASPGTRTQPSIRIRALRLMMALVTVHVPSTRRASAPTRRVPEGGRSAPRCARPAGRQIDQGAGDGCRRADGDRGGAHHGVVQLAHRQGAHQQVDLVGLDRPADEET
jgi:hypothetical protein